MEAQERGKPILLCQRCFALIPEGAEYCAECGAPAMDDLSEGTERAVYPELARANLLRMRGEYKQAEDICLAVLRRHPNSATANTLLGDICAERGDLKQAAEWYEMALDIVPDSASDRQKLESVRNRTREHEAAQTAKSLGLPETKPKVGLWAGGALIFVLLIAIVAYLLGERSNDRRARASNDVVAPISIPLDSTRTSSPAKAEEKAPPEAPEMSADVGSRVRAAAAEEAGRLVYAAKIANSSSLIVVLGVTGNEDPRGYAAIMGRIALGAVPEATAATLVTLFGERMVYVGTMARAALEVTQTEQWIAEHGNDPAALANATLSNEWPPPAAPAAPTNPPAENAGGFRGNP